MAEQNTSGAQFGVTWNKVGHYLGHGLDTTFSLNGTDSPRVDYVVLGQEIELRVSLNSRQRAPASKMPMIRIDEVVSRGTRYARLRTADPTLRRDFHDLICAIAERMVIHRQSLEQALAETVHAWNALLRGPRVLRQQRVIGLLGELAVLWTLGTDEQIGWVTAVDAWLGAANEEHDFAFADHDVEVKTTSLTKPMHTIHGIEQLTPKQGRRLWLVSLQVTRGGDAGVSLAAAARAVRRQLMMDAPGRIVDFDEALATVGWEETVQDEDRWMLAGAPQVFAVEDGFPRIDASFLDALPIVNRSRIDLITYRVDLAGIVPSTDGPEALSNVRLPDVRTA